MMDTGTTWTWAKNHQQWCLVIEGHSLWGEDTCRVWLSRTDSVVRVPAGSLKIQGSIDHQSLSSSISYVSAAARVTDAFGLPGTPYLSCRDVRP